MAPEVSLVIVVHNAFRYCVRLLRSLPRTRDVRYEVVVVDNKSRLPTRLLLVLAALLGRIHRLCLLDRNTLFAEGNNIGVAAAARDAPLVLLLNSDVEVRDPRWLRRLVDAHRPGVTSLGFTDARDIPRADGYCFLIDRGVFEAHGGLDEAHQWFWGITKLQASVLRDGLSVQAVREHDDLLVHFGGKSGSGHKGAAGMDAQTDDIRSWFGGREPRVAEQLGDLAGRGR